ncbi:hypothetical protein HaLaN_20258 [Haematococcus lacustris]|uniref:Guanylate cyclase domain-containing protein n=1 Tax=Haematococcus lacustris TaxID=44745 RepID=A0A699ZVG7_HAELA|nr:hypothetical protein HaLaN_20258 [Haematococcus lacustris]
MEELRAGGISVVHMGQHLVALGEGKPDTALDLYCATLHAPAHAHRLWALGPLRTVRQLQPGVLHAPHSWAATAFMSVAGLPHVRAWDADLAQVGVDVGEVACDLTPANGRFNYRGRCLNRAARINSIAETGQPLGEFELRGIPGQVALLQVALAPHSSKAQLSASHRLGLTAPGLQLNKGAAAFNS